MRMKFSVSVCAAAVVAMSALNVSSSQAQVAGQSKSVSHTGRKGSTVSGSATVGPRAASGQATATGPKGKTASATGSATYGPNHATGQATVAGPNGKTANASGTATTSNGSVTYSGTATGPRGTSRAFGGTKTQGQRTAKP